MSCQQFYDKFKVDRFSIAKCPNEMTTLKLCLGMYTANQDNLCKELKFAWITCMK